MYRKLYLSWLWETLLCVIIIVLGNRCRSHGYISWVDGGPALAFLLTLLSKFLTTYIIDTVYNTDYRYQIKYQLIHTYNGIGSRNIIYENNHTFYEVKFLLYRKLYFSSYIDCWYDLSFVILVAMPVLLFYFQHLF